MVAKEHYIVAIGASAGGLEAIHAFFDNVSETQDLSFVIIQHLSPDHKSLLVELVAKHTEMKVYEAGDGMVVEKSCIYVIPPRKVMAIGEGKIQLSDKPASDKGPNTAIDHFFHSLANDKGDKAVGVILSGTGTDGTRGAESIKAVGGTVIVQDPQTAKFDGMPRSAIASGMADYILSPEQMPAEVNNLIQETPIGLFRDGRMDEKLLNEMFRLIEEHTNCNFKNYKLPTILRRTARRMAHHHIKFIDEYISYLKEHDEECVQLSKEFLIGVTRFFRDPGAYEILRTSLLPQLIDEKTDDEAIKVWVCACSSGEEAYSLAMLIDDCLRQKGKQYEVKIFATDIDGPAIEKASKGLYAHSIPADLPEQYLERYFTKQETGYCIIPRIRKQVVFARHNVISDPPIIKNDLVSCRNMLIYMSASLQKKVIASLDFSLNTGGILMLGPSENPADAENLEELNRKWKIYRKHTTSASSRRPSTYGISNGGFSLRKPVLQAKANSRTIGDDFRESLIEDFLYAAIYIDDNYEVKEAIGEYKRYIALPEHSLNLNLLKMIPSELATILGAAIRKAWAEGEKVHLPNFRLNDAKDNGSRLLHIVIKPPKKDNGVPYTLITFGESEHNAALGTGILDVDKIEAGDNEFISRLKFELKETRLNLQAAIEELETTNEELQSANEEMLSSNEELQSSNEELQSLNEELHTLNTEHQQRIAELVELNDDLNNYFRSVDIGQIFLDRQLYIRKFNPAAVKLINLIDSDLGRPFSNISTNIRTGDITAAITEVMEKGHMVEMETLLTSGKTSLLRILPYIRQDKKADGVVLSFIDISAIKNLNNIITGVFNSSQNAIMALKAVRDEHNNITDFTWLTANGATEGFYQLKREAFIGKMMKQVMPGVVKKGLFSKYVSVVHTGEPIRFEYPVKCAGKEGWWEISAVKMMDGLAVTISDISEKKIADQKLQENYDELVRTKDELRALNEDLENKVVERAKKLAQSEERFRLVSQATNDGIRDWNIQTDSLWLSDSFYKMFRYNKEQRQPDLRYWLDKIHPDDYGRVKQSLFEVIDSGEQQWSAEYSYKTADGGYRQILDRGYIINDESGKPARMLNSMLDVTSLRRAEQNVISNIEQRKFLAESMPLIVWTAQPEGEVDFLNQQFVTYSGMPVDQGKGMGWLQIVEPAYIQPLQARWKNALLKRRDFSIELKLRRSDGVYRWHLLRAKARIKEDGTLMMWVGTNTDIHEQKLAMETMEAKVAERTQELKKINLQLEMSNHDLQQFASVASHDLKEPLRKIHMFSQMLKDRFLKNETGAAEYIERIIGSSSRMTSLINDLLNFSRLSVNNPFEPVHLNTLIDEVLADLELAITEKNARVEVGEFPVVDGVPGQLRQVFQNIISNALKFTQRGVKPVIKVEAVRLKDKRFNAAADAQGKYLRVRISDNGIGFDDQFRDKIFTIFQRLHTRQEYEGTGIGLAICKKIIDKHNGIITAQSKENVGTTFTFIIPIKQERQVY